MYQVNYCRVLVGVYHPRQLAVFDLIIRTTMLRFLTAAACLPLVSAWPLWASATAPPPASAAVRRPGHPVPVEHRARVLPLHGRSRAGRHHLQAHRARRGYQAFSGESVEVIAISVRRGQARVCILQRHPDLVLQHLAHGPWAKYNSLWGIDLSDS